MREHRLNLMKEWGFKDYSLDDFTLRSPESLADNPFMRFIGYHYPVKVYRDIVYVREHKVIKHHHRKGLFNVIQDKQKDGSIISETSSFHEEEDLFVKLLKAHKLLDTKLIGEGAKIDPKK